ncbi:MAG TPA: aminotransferase class IV [Cryptosporangiaceae bacterium]|nr:aminotransferase class IV [Cryptosporangiaceae bacterium]
MDTRVLAVLGRGIVPLDTPLLRADDLGVTRGDGVFETMHVRAGTGWLRDEHLARMGRSAAALDLTLPPVEDLAALVDTAVGGWTSDAEAGIKLVCTRGPEGDEHVPAGPVTVFALVFAAPRSMLRQRRDGVRVATATLGVSADGRATAPWLLGGVKSLSYAMNMAVLRWAAREGNDDVLLVSSDGEALEGPTSSVVWVADGALRTVPPETGILPGTTAAYLLDHAGQLGLRAERRRARVEDLLAADGVWLCSSVRGAARVTELDGKTLVESALTGPVHDLLGFPA